MITRTHLTTAWLLAAILLGAIGLTIASTPHTAAQPAPGPSIRLVRATFDPLIETPDLPDDLTLRAYPAGGDGIYLAQFDGPVQQAWKDELRRLGAQLFDYVPDYAFLARMDEATATRVADQPAVRWVGLYQPAYRLSPHLDGVDGSQTVTLQTLPTVDAAALRAELEGLGAVVHNVSLNRFGGYFYLTVEAAQLSALARLPSAVWVEPYAPPRLLNDVARGAGIMQAESVWQNLGLHGEGQVVGVCDTGLDVGANDATMNDDFEGRIVALNEFGVLPLDGPDDRCSGHGTHVAGSVLGNGSNSGSDPASQDYADSYAGVAPEAELVFQAVEWASDPPDGCTLSGLLFVNLNSLFQDAYDDGARIHTNSWGSPVGGAYSDTSQQTDQFAWEHKDMTILFAAGNEGVDVDPTDGVIDLDSLMAPATAKNCIAVGASENYRPVLTSTYGSGWPDDFPAEPIAGDPMADNPLGMAAFSSRGPTDDGRIKPDLLAPGTWVLSVYSQANHPDDGGNQYDGWGEPLNRWYKYMGGTSMATPLTAGAAALVRDYYNDVAGLATPSSALIKATLINGAYDMTPGQHGSGAHREIVRRPDTVQGWGRVDLANSLMPAAPRTWWYDDHDAGLSTDDTVIYTSTADTPLIVLDGSEFLRVSLVWTDYPGSTTADVTLVNDLDLEIIAPDGTHYYGNDINGTAGDRDRINNVEEVHISAPATGVYTITVHAHNVAQDTQPYALIVSGALGNPDCQALDTVALQAPGSVPVGESVPFTATIAPATATLPIHYSWDFGDDQGSSGTLSTTQHIYESPGLYTAMVTATNCVWNGLATDTLQIEAVCTPLTETHLLTDSPVEAGQSAHFTATVDPADANSPIHYAWDFGDDTKESGTLSTTSHLYAQPGLYTVTMTATNCGGSAVATDTAPVEVACVTLDDVAAEADDPVLAGTPMQFHATVAPVNATDPISYAWDFGAAGSGSGLDGPDPVFTYSVTGTHNVVVTATNCDAGDPVTDALDVLVQDTCQPLQGIAASADGPGATGQPLSFQTIVTPTDATRPIAYLWDFGAAGQGSGLDGPAPTFTYTEAGTHTVVVTATNCDGGDPVTDTLQVVVEESCYALQGVTASADDPVLLGYPMHFQATLTPTSATPPLTYGWNFGAAGEGSGQHGPTPTFTYSVTGTHNVSVVAANCGGDGWAVDSLDVVVHATCRPLLAMQASADAPVTLGEAMHFQIVLTPTDATRPIAYLWDFGAAGSGSGLDGPTPIFTYTEPGTHTVVATATNCDGSNPVNDTLTVEVQEVCQRPGGVDFDWGPQPVYVGVTTMLTASVGTATPPLTYTWRFGDDGQSSTGGTGVVSHTFDVSNTFPVTLTVASPCGAAEPVAHDVAVLSRPGGFVYLPLVLKQR